MIVVDHIWISPTAGIDAACSKYSCIWCKCPSDERYDPDRKWSVANQAEGARTVEENIELASRRGKKFNVSHRPLFPSIPLSNVVIDNLHLFLRVADVLINLLITELKRQDAIEKVKHFTSFDPVKYRHLDKFQKFVSSLGIPDFQFYVGRTSRQLKCRTLTGPEKVKLLKHIQIEALLPTLPKCRSDEIQHLWIELLKLNEIFSKRPEQLTACDADAYEEKARQWGRDFIAVYHTTNITPYIHAMMNHVSEFMHLHSSILPFTQQGLEKYNDIITKSYFRCTNHRGEQALIQIMEKQNHIEHLQDIGVTRKKCFEIACQNCGKAGHNRCTCIYECSKCGHTPFCSHLIDCDGHKKPACDMKN